MVITCVGAGNLATNLCLALQRAGHVVAQVWSRTETSVHTLADTLGCAWTTDLNAVNDAVDLIVCSVKDSVLVDVAQHFSNTAALVVHTAGSMPLESLPQARRGVLYPMQTFSKARPVRSFAHIPVCIEAQHASDLELLRSLALSLSEKVYLLSSDQRARLHVAAVFACNFANHCYALSEQLLKEAGIPFDIMLPLVDETASKVHQLSPHDAQTGPAVRWDENVIARHLDALEGTPRDIYELMSRSIHNTHA